MTIGATPQHALSTLKQVYPTQSQQDYISLDADTLLRLFLAEISKRAGALERLLHRKQEMDMFSKTEDRHE